MTDSLDLGLAGAEAESDLHSPQPEAAPATLALPASAAKLARSLAWIPGQRESRDFHTRYRKLIVAFRPVLAVLESPPAPNESADFRRLREDLLLLDAELQDIAGTFQSPHKIPQVRTRDGAVVSRIAAVAADFLGSVGFEFSEPTFTSLHSGLPGNHSSQTGRAVDAHPRNEISVARTDCESAPLFCLPIHRLLTASSSRSAVCRRSNKQTGRSSSSR